MCVYFVGMCWGVWWWCYGVGICGCEGDGVVVWGGCLWWMG